VNLDVLWYRSCVIVDMPPNASGKPVAPQPDVHECWRRTSGQEAFNVYMPKYLSRGSGDPIPDDHLILTVVIGASLLTPLTRYQMLTGIGIKELSIGFYYDHVFAFLYKLG
jgi:hypothetical protein